MKAKESTPSQDFPVVDKKEDAAYVLRFLFVIRENQSNWGEGAQEHARVNVWLLDTSGSVDPGT